MPKLKQYEIECILSNSFDDATALSPVFLLEKIDCFDIARQRGSHRTN